MGKNLLCLPVKNILDSHRYVSHISSPYLIDLLLKILEIYKKNALTWSIFELQKCSFFLNGSEFRQKLIGTIIRGLVRHLRA